MSKKKDKAKSKANKCKSADEIKILKKVISKLQKRCDALEEKTASMDAVLEPQGEVEPQGEAESQGTS